MSDQNVGPARFVLPQILLLIIGAFYLLWGITGLFFLGDPATDLVGHDTGRLLLGVELNGVQSLAHVVIAIVALGGAAAVSAARISGVAVFVGCLVLVVVGLLGAVRPELNVFSVNFAGTLIHALTALVALGAVFARVHTPPGQQAGPAHPR
ncbi:MAG TPA: DUF4383 domain-containing protein [Pseudonocardia sp.]